MHPTDDSDFEKPGRSSMEEYAGLITGENLPRSPRGIRAHLSKCAGIAAGLTISLLLTLCIYLLLLRNLPVEVQTLVEDYGYTGPLPIQYNDTRGPYIECPEVPFPAHPPDCTFDLLANGWVPNPCFDAELHHDMVDGHDYGFFRDRWGKDKLHQDVILRGNISDFATGLWVHFHEHVDHCWYLLNGSVRATAMQSIGRLDVWVDEEHMQHCFGLIKKKGDPTFIDYHVKALFWHHRCYLGRV
ncbi:uncharacterized protein BJX67DRAFT_31382 [Aspergillus lucknowensis]|uniref:Uncharacterized protein n=1 Tax=Aspergillus lucknowensis TaxID=176173 RepID=A0ABR4LX08_9EURO